MRGEVQCDERTRAGGVQAQRGTLEAEDVRDATGHHARRVAGQQVALGAFGRVRQSRPVLLGLHTDEHTGTAAAQRGRVHTRAFQCLPGDLEHQALLGVHRGRLTRGDPEELGVELACRVQEPAVAAVGLPGFGRVRVEDPLDVPLAVGGEAGHGVDALVDQAPQRFRRVDHPREPAADADDRDVVVVLDGPERRRGTEFVVTRAQARGQCERVRVVVDDGHGQFETGGRDETRVQLDRRQRVEPQVEERPGAAAHGRCAGHHVGENLRGHAHDEIAQCLCRPARVSRGQLVSPVPHLAGGRTEVIELAQVRTPQLLRGTSVMANIASDPGKAHRDAELP
ncbi:hypothetical protein GCM10017774_29600 [Lentzea cavernae]|uniref:Uncharacterized protein n=1 Tax=Lentzea cavernae TaxID=2020703 RepID=A0ABQ3MD27_9PSEU|nr:hypothetical protein GCM10017774_29600 [Lentzea cavernae]